MIIDLNKVEIQDNFFKKFDLCIVGAGAAGIAIAQNLNGEKFSVCLIEETKKIAMANIKSNIENKKIYFWSINTKK